MTNTKWTLDPAHSELQFKVKHMMVSNVTGEFKDFQVQVETPGESIEKASIHFTANTDSVSTGNNQRDGHLKSGDFFDAAKFPEMKFVSSSFEKINQDDDYELKGNLTIRDVTKPVTLQVNHGGIAKDPWGNLKAGFSISGKINRKDWGLNYNAVLEAGGVMVSDEVRILAELEMTATN